MTNEPEMNAEEAPALPTRRSRRSLSDNLGIWPANDPDAREYQRALDSAGVQTALFELEGAKSRRDSIARKLAYGSTAVTVDLLERWEAALSTAKHSLWQIAYHHPILLRHPVIATAAAERTMSREVVYEDALKFGAKA